jgi:hypothetical protein
MQEEPFVIGLSDVLSAEQSPPAKATGADAITNISTDWTAKLPTTAHVEFFRSTNWAATPLGTLQTWSASLRRAVYMLLADCRPACIFW